jgi:hypothetical protein
MFQTTLSKKMLIAIVSRELHLVHPVAFFRMKMEDKEACKFKL